MSEYKFTAADLDEEFHQMTREELLQDIAYRIQSDREMMAINWKERQAILAENKELRDAINFGTSVIEDAKQEIEYFGKVLKDNSKTISMWRKTSYILATLLLWLGVFLIFS
ncbi:hypothetical protein ACMXYY_13335 [Acinetobacter courvalinii]